MSTADAALNYDDSQTAQGRSFAKNPSPTEKHNTVPEEGRPRRHSYQPHPSNSDSQGITNHAASEEAKGQEKVVSQRPDSQAGINHSK